MRGALGGRFLGLCACAFNRFEKSRSSAIGRRQGDRGLRNRRRVVGDHRRSAAERERTIIENDFGFADLNATAARECDWSFDYRSVVEGAIGRSQVLQKIFVPFVAHFSVHSRGERVRNTQIVPSRASNSDAQAADLKMFSGSIRIFDYQLSHKNFVAQAASLRSETSENLQRPAQACSLPYSYAPCGRGLRAGATIGPAERRTTIVPAIQSVSARPV